MAKPQPKLVTLWLIPGRGVRIQGRHCEGKVEIEDTDGIVNRLLARGIATLTPQKYTKAKPQVHPVEGVSNTPRKLKADKANMVEESEEPEGGLDDEDLIGESSSDNKPASKPPSKARRRNK